MTEAAVDTEASEAPEARPVRFSTADCVGVIELNRPDAANAVSLDLAASLRGAVAAIESDPAAGAVVLTGNGALFCGGGDLRLCAASDDLPQLLLDTTDELHAAVAALVRSRLPVVAAVRGAVAGAGLGLMMSADLVVAGTSSSFTAAYTAVGLSPDGGTSWLLPRRVGEQRALEMVLTNRRLSASEALDWGLVTEVVPDDEVTARALELAGRLAAGSAPAAAEARRLLRSAFTSSLERHLEDEATTIAECAAGADAREGITAFLEKRRPRFAT